MYTDETLKNVKEAIMRGDYEIGDKKYKYGENAVAINEVLGRTASQFLLFFPKAIELDVEIEVDKEKIEISIIDENKKYCYTKIPTRYLDTLGKDMIVNMLTETFGSLSKNYYFEATSYPTSYLLNNSENKYTARQDKLYHFTKYPEIETEKIRYARNIIGVYKDAIDCTTDKGFDNKEKEKLLLALDIIGHPYYPEISKILEEEIIKNKKEKISSMQVSEETIEKIFKPTINENKIEIEETEPEL